MKVQVNGTTVEIYEGAKVKNVVRKYSMEAYEGVVQGRKMVIDQHDHSVSLQGELTGLEKFKIINAEEIG